MADSKPHWTFWVIASLMLVWNTLGCINFFVQMDPEVLAAYRETEQAIVANRPAWATIGFAVAVFGGVFGCILLLFRQSVAIYIFIVSFAGVVVTMVHTLTVDISFGVGEIVGIILMPLIIAGFLIWYTLFAKRKHWIY